MRLGSGVSSSFFNIFFGFRFFFLLFADDDVLKRQIITGQRSSKRNDIRWMYCVCVCQCVLVSVMCL